MLDLTVKIIVLSVPSRGHVLPEIAELNRIRLDEDLTLDELATEISSVAGGDPIDGSTLSKLFSDPDRRPIDRTLHKIRRFLDDRKAAIAGPAKARQRQVIPHASDDARSVPPPVRPKLIAPVAEAQDNSLVLRLVREAIDELGWKHEAVAAAMSEASGRKDRWFLPVQEC